MEVMLTLMRKDWRLYRAPVIGTVLIGIGPYLLYALFAMLGLRFAAMGFERDSWLELMAFAAMLSLAGLAIVGSAFGGMAWAAERTDRSATFLAVLPPTRLQLAASKLAVAGVWLAFCFVVDASVGLTIMSVSGGLRIEQHLPADFPTLIFQDATYGLAAFGVAWGCSAFLGSSAISAVIGVVTGLAASTAIGLADSKHRLALWIATSLSLAVLGVFVGTARAVWRVEP